MAVRVERNNDEAVLARSFCLATPRFGPGTSSASAIRSNARAIARRPSLWQMKAMITMERMWSGAPANQV